MKSTALDQVCESTYLDGLPGACALLRSDLLRCAGWQRRADPGRHEMEASARRDVRPLCAAGNLPFRAALPELLCFNNRVRNSSRFRSQAANHVVQVPKPPARPASGIDSYHFSTFAVACATVAVHDGAHVPAAGRGCGLRQAHLHAVAHLLRLQLPGPRRPEPREVLVRAHWLVRATVHA